MLPPLWPHCQNSCACQTCRISYSTRLSRPSIFLPSATWTTRTRNLQSGVRFMVTQLRPLLYSRKPWKDCGRDTQLLYRMAQSLLAMSCPQCQYGSTLWFTAKTTNLITLWLTAPGCTFSCCGILFWMTKFIVECTQHLRCCKLPSSTRFLRGFVKRTPGASPTTRAFQLGTFSPSPRKTSPLLVQSFRVLIPCVPDFWTQWPRRCFSMLHVHIPEQFQARSNSRMWSDLHEYLARMEGESVAFVNDDLVGCFY